MHEESVLNHQIPRELSVLVPCFMLPLRDKFDSADDADDKTVEERAGQAEARDSQEQDWISNGPLPSQRTLGQALPLLT